jgi:hypothetical protein
MLDCGLSNATFETPNHAFALRLLDFVSKNKFTTF